VVGGEGKPEENAEVSEHEVNEFGIKGVASIAPPAKHITPGHSSSSS
jgi:hypothetical protein